jgi:two-component system, sensor histidine kinase and response regulator
MNLGFGGSMGRRLLIVGDPALSRGLMKMVLSRLGYVVTCVVSGQEAQMALAHTQFALALIALQLPDLPGLTLARRLRHSPAPVGAMPIIMFGDAWDPERILESCRDARLEGYLPKPISIARLVSSVHDQIHRLPADPGALTSMSRPAPLDLDRLASFTDGDPQLERELASLYVSTAVVYVGEMRAAIGGGGSGWSRAAHALKGASANIGATELARLAGEAEHGAPSADWIARLETALDAVRAFLRERQRFPAVHGRTALAGTG